MAVLLKNNIDMLIDIRSRPQYTNNTEFLQAKLIINLKAENIQYKYLLFAFIVALSLLANITVASFIGSSLPLLLR